jgi:hypothetical protein
MSTIPERKSSKPRTLEELLAAPAAPDPEALLREAGAERRELARRLTVPLDELLEDAS